MVLALGPSNRLHALPSSTLESVCNFQDKGCYTLPKILSDAFYFGGSIFRRWREVSRQERFPEWVSNFFIGPACQEGQGVQWDRCIPYGKPNWTVLFAGFYWWLRNTLVWHKKKNGEKRAEYGGDDKVLKKKKKTLDATTWINSIHARMNTR